ncbi:hypothetical protein RR48_03860 [Papilio machaon]|uniref:Secreted protein n=1 Tax=Papilio machaon TaxID=76193 RepID=A0A0N1IPW9_PAPMA|nr:hypothetical protein RR48_03860 [Papilio machaon]
MFHLTTIVCVVVGELAICAVANDHLVPVPCFTTITKASLFNIEHRATDTVVRRFLRHRYTGGGQRRVCTRRLPLVTTSPAKLLVTRPLSLSVFESVCRNPVARPQVLMLQVVS